MGDYSLMSEDLPLMANIGEFVTFIQREDPDANQICQFAVLRTFSFLEGFAFFSAALGPDGVITTSGHFGFTPEVMSSWRTSSIDDDIPTSDALKTNNIIWVSDKDSWNRDYPHLAKYENDYTTNTFIAWPITVRGAYMSVLGLCARKSISPNPSLISFFETIGGLIALQLSQKSESASGKVETPESLLPFLTRRQRDVLRLVSDGLTNAQIGEELGFSESTIRQETMRIYEILGASGRAEATAIYRTTQVR